MTRHDVRRCLTAAAAATGLILLAGCGLQWPVNLPVRPAGQIPDDYQIEPARALVIARIHVTTDGQSGFGPISNPMYLEFNQGGDASKENVQDLTIADPRDQFFTSEAHRPMLWRYAQPGLLAMSLSPGTYDGIIIAYPDTSRLDRPADSIPAPNRPMLFAPLKIAPNTVVYIGDVEVKQTISWADLMFDRIQMNYAVVDRYDQTVADFRARHPQFQNAPIEKRLMTAIAANESSR